MKTISALIAAALLSVAGTAWAQLRGFVPPIGSLLDPVRSVTDEARSLVGRSAVLADARLDRVAALIRAHPREIALDAQGNPARAHELVVEDPPATLAAAAGAKGFRLIEQDMTLGIGYARFEAPGPLSLKAAAAALRKLGARSVSADQLHFQSGTAASPAPPVAGNGPMIGMIDGGVAGSAVMQRGFATGAPKASDHGTAVASLISGHGRVGGAAPNARILAADVYGSDPAGGSAVAIVKALGWLVGERVSVVTISLVGPANPLLARVVAAAQQHGVAIVAAVGNDGPVSPYAYPASYPGVIAVTAVDGRKRILIEAGRATHLDYAAPGADMIAATMQGGTVSVRGTSFAAPLAAATIVKAYPVADPARRAAALASVDAKAEKLGSRYGRGLLCGRCATPK